MKAMLTILLLAGMISSCAQDSGSSKKSDTTQPPPLNNEPYDPSKTVTPIDIDNFTGISMVSYNGVDYYRRIQFTREEYEHTPGWFKGSLIIFVNDHQAINTIDIYNFTFNYQKVSDGLIQLDLVQGPCVEFRGELNQIKFKNVIETKSSLMSIYFESAEIMVSSIDGEMYQDNFKTFSTKTYLPSNYGEVRHTNECTKLHDYPLPSQVFN